MLLVAEGRASCTAVPHVRSAGRTGERVGRPPLLPGAAMGGVRDCGGTDWSGALLFRGWRMSASRRNAVAQRIEFILNVLCPKCHVDED
jgi:hypothetical protein